MLGASLKERKFYLANADKENTINILPIYNEFYFCMEWRRGQGPFSYTIPLERH